MPNSHTTHTHQAPVTGRIETRLMRLLEHHGLDAQGRPVRSTEESTT